MEAIFMGVSQSRNPNLAAVFYRLGLVESYGTGIRKIMRLYQGLDRQPVFKSAEGAFTVELFNRNEKPETSVAEGIGMDSQTEPFPETEEIQTAVYQKAKNQGQVTRKEVEQEFGFGSTKAFKVLKALCEAGLLIQQKSGNRTVYLPLK